MNLDAVIGLLGMALGLLLTLAFQAHQKALKAVSHVEKAIKEGNELSDQVRYQLKVITDQTKAHIDVYQGDLDKRLQKLELRLDDVNTRVAQLQIKR